MESVKSFPWDAAEMKLPQPEVPTTPVLDLLSILGVIPLLSGRSSRARDLSLDDKEQLL